MLGDAWSQDICSYILLVAIHSDRTLDLFMCGGARAPVTNLNKLKYQHG